MMMELVEEEEIAAQVQYRRHASYLVERNSGIPKDVTFYHEVLPALPEDRFMQYPIALKS